MEFLHAKGGKLYCGAQPILLRGMGLGGWLLPEGYMWKFYTKCDRPRRIEALIERLCGVEYAASFWAQYFATYITEEDIAWIAAQGMNSVRLALNSRLLFEVAPDGTVTFRASALHLVDSCVAWCKRHGIYVILDMHGAPGGQTGQNIDDCEHNRPELFTNEAHQDTLVEMWKLLAQHYREEPAIGGYDLLNEPLPNFFGEYAPKLLPLYRRLIAAIREIDAKHLIILEGLHWATDFSVFDGMTKVEAANNLLLQFHKYWSAPDEESLAPFLQTAKRLNVPLWMGEGGENNLPWYTTVFPLYERLGIGWCFWSYKKMETPNSPVTFAQPNGWQEILDYLDGGAQPSRSAAIAAFDGLLSCIRSSTYHPEIVNAILRRPPLRIPAEAFDAEQIRSTREIGADFRSTSRATLLYADGHIGAGDWRRYGGEPQPERERMLLRLHEGDCVAYRIQATADPRAKITVHRHGSGTLITQHDEADPTLIWVRCTSSTVDIEAVEAAVTE